MLTTKDFRNTATRFRETSAQARAVEDDLRRSVDSRTAAEKEALDRAVTAYQAAVKRELASPSNRRKLQQLDGYSKEMQGTLERCFEAFEKTVSSIQASSDPPGTKRTKINQTADFVMGQLFTEEERALFGNVLSSVVVVIPNKDSQQSLLHAPEQDGWAPVHVTPGGRPAPLPSDVRMLPAPRGSY